MSDANELLYEGVRLAGKNNNQVSRWAAKVHAHLSQPAQEPVAHVVEFAAGLVCPSWLSEDPTSEPPVPVGTKLYAAPPSAEVPANWWPIETAPKDGSYILLSNRGGSWIGSWEPVAVSGYRFEQPWRSKMLNHYHICKDARYAPPTHWMPLPDTPSMIRAAQAQGESK
jgi:hypothetical protein